MYQSQIDYIYNIVQKLKNSNKKNKNLANYIDQIYICYIII